MSDDARRPDNNEEPMRSTRDQMAVVRFAVSSRDRRLVELLARMLANDSEIGLGVARRTCDTLAERLHLAERAL